MERGRLSDTQVSVLLRPIKSNRVYQSQGQSHVAAYDITAHLTRMFGFDGWDKEIIRLELVGERAVHDEKKKRDGWYATYLCLMRLTIYSPDGKVAKVIEEGATGSASNQPDYGDAHDLAMKNAMSYAIKRCAKDLGDQFGLSLYGKGSTKALVGRVVDHETTIVDDHVEDVTEDDVMSGESPG